MDVKLLENELNGRRIAYSSETEFLVKERGNANLQRQA